MFETDNPLLVEAFSRYFPLPRQQNIRAAHKPLGYSAVDFVLQLPEIRFGLSERENIRVEQNQEGEFDRNFDRNTEITQYNATAKRFVKILEIADF